MMEAPEVTNGLPARPRASIPWRGVLTQLVTIIAGVLIALAAQAWWTGRQDRSREVRYMRQLRADLVATRARLDRGIAFQDSSLLRNSRMIQMLRSIGDEPPEDSIVVWARLSTGASPRPATATIAAMLSTGDIALITDDSLRDAIVDYAAQVEQAQASLARQNTEFLSRGTAVRDRLEPHLIHPATRWQDTLQAVRSDHHDVAGMRRDRLLQAAYFSTRQTYVNYRARFSEMRDAGDALIAMIERRGPGK
jgi:hypothetical protein